MMRSRVFASPKWPAMGVQCAAWKIIFLDYLGDFSPGDGRGHLRAPSLCFLNGRDGRIEEILEVFLPPSEDIPS